MNHYVAYYRVSTKQQGQSGLGLDSQKRDVKRFTKGCPDCLLAEYTEVESGSNNQRPQLLEAIAHAKRTEAKLLIAKLDRLSRNASFIFTLRDSGVSFTCVDMPEANHLTISILAVLAEDERKRISERTRKALAELKERGVKLGNPIGFTNDSRKKAIETKRRNASNNQNSNRAKKQIRNYIRLAVLDNIKVTNKSVSRELNEQGLKTTQGKDFTPNNVRYLLKQVRKEMQIA